MILFILIQPISSISVLLVFILKSVECHPIDWVAAPKNSWPDGEVVSVNVIYRHGHKEYKASFPYDPHKSSPYWTEGPNQLTKLGKQQAHFLGQNLRQRYLHLIPDDTVSWKAVKAYSSDKARTLMSSAVVLAGLLPPEENEKFSYLDWQPVPIYTDQTLGYFHCPRIEELLQNKLIRFKPSYNKLYKFVSQHSGAYVSRPGSIAKIYASLEIQKQAKMVLPMWSYAVYDDMKREAAKSFSNPQSLELNRLRFGRLLKKITHFNDTSRLSHPIKLYCTHDTVIGGILSALSINITEPPNFGAAIVIEFRIVGRQYHAQILYRNGPLDQLIRFPWPGCGLRCPVKRLEEILKPLIPDDWDKECKVFSPSSESYVNIALVIILISAVFIFILIGYTTLIFELILRKIKSFYHIFKRISPKLKSRDNK